MSFKPEVQTDDTGNWYGNARRFATREEAEAQVLDLMMRWTSVRDMRVVESEDAVNYQYVEGRLERRAGGIDTGDDELGLTPLGCAPGGVFAFWPSSFFNFRR